MNIKFKKMFKTAIIFFTVFVMVFNSFAAISVSDGSAFVTKAEFSADLNNLSNRMSALENSIDAKIDSLVSSYLSRNGIWNGERQTISNSSQNNFNGYFFATIGYGAKNEKYTASDTAYNKSFYLCAADQRSNINGYSGQTVYKIGAYGQGTYTIIKEISKSGLICVNYQYFCASGSPLEGSDYRKRFNYGRLGWVCTNYGYGWSAPLRWEFFEADQTNNKVGSSLFSLEQQNNNGTIQIYDASAKVVYSDITTSFYAFVSKGNKLNITGTLSNSTALTNQLSTQHFVALLSYSDNVGDNMGIFSVIAISNAYVY